MVSREELKRAIETITEAMKESGKDVKIEIETTACNPSLNNGSKYRYIVTTILWNKSNGIVCMEEIGRSYPMEDSWDNPNYKPKYSDKLSGTISFEELANMIMNDEKENN